MKQNNKKLIFLINNFSIYKSPCQNTRTDAKALPKEDTSS